ncbi:MAG: dienelactone hydrolase family protein [Ferruginibacter sp.]
MKINILLICLIIFCAIGSADAQPVFNSGDLNFPYKNMPGILPGTKQLVWDGDLSVKMLDGAHKFIDEKINQSIASRLKYWNRDFSTTGAYELSVEPNRKRFMKYIGVEDKTAPPDNYNIGLEDKNPPVYLEKNSIDNNTELVGETTKYRIYQVRWSVLNRVNGEGLLLQPKLKPIANIIALPDADQTPEQLAGLLPGIPEKSQFARQLAENGFQVLIPVLISRTLLFPGKPEQQTYREWIYRQAFHMGRHIIGYEVQKVISAVDWFKQKGDKDLKVGVAGYCEGGLIAFYSAAADKRIDVVLVSGYFNSRQKVWDEPIYRNVWGLLSEFGDAEIASLIAPRPIIVEYSSVPELVDDLKVPGNKHPQIEGLTFTGYKGRLQTALFKDVKAEYDRIDQLVLPGFQPRQLVSGENYKPLSFGSQEAIEKFALLLGLGSLILGSNEGPADNRRSFDPEERQVRQVKEIEDHVQWLLRNSDQERNKFFLYKVMPEFGVRTWSNKPYHPYFSPGHFIEEAKEYRKYFHEEILGKFDEKLLAPNARTRKIYDKEKWTGYEVVLDVFTNLFATGILLIPKDIKPGEKRPIVVCQHGRNDIPQKLIEGNYNYYNDMAAKLADQGFIVYAPQNPYRGEDRYRWLSRKANSLKKSLFSFIISQHDQTIQWLGSLPFSDSKRIAFYGLSYGGETAMRVPSVLEGYCLSICSGDFGDWTRKVVDTHSPRSFMNTIEWEMPYFNMGNTFSYAEMAYLIFPRPFMVERGHHDMVQPDEWVASEYARVKYFYDQFNLGDKTAIEFFNGGHSMKIDGTFKFLHKQLNWP